MSGDELPFHLRIRVPHGEDVSLNGDIFDLGGMDWSSIKTVTSTTYHEPEVHHLMDHGDHNRFPLLSRDWEDIDCGVKACANNRIGKCGVPSLCKIGEDGRCEGFVLCRKSKKEGEDLKEAIAEAIEKCDQELKTEE